MDDVELGHVAELAEPLHRLAAYEHAAASGKRHAGECAQKRALAGTGARRLSLQTLPALMFRLIGLQIVGCSTSTRTCDAMTASPVDASFSKSSSPSKMMR